MLLAILSGRDWIDWSGWGFTVGGTVLALVGLVFTFVEARKAKNAATAAEVAADRARESVAARITTGDLTLIRKELQAVLAGLEGGRIETALFSVRASREALNRLRERMGSEQRRFLLNRAVKDVAALQIVLEEALYQGMPLSPISEISESLSQHMDAMIQWSEQMTFSSDGAS